MRINGYNFMTKKSKERLTYDIQEPGSVNKPNQAAMDTTKAVLFTAENNRIHRKAAGVTQ